MEIIEANEKAFLRRYGKSLADLLLNNIITATDIEKYEEVISNNRTVYDIDPGQNLVAMIAGILDGSFLRKYLESDLRVRIICFEPDVGFFLYVCAKRDISDLIGNERLWIVVSDQDVLRNTMRELIDQHTIGYISLFVNQQNVPLYKKAGEIIIKITEKIGRELMFSKNFRKGYSVEVCKNELFALSVLQNNYLVTSLMKALPDREIPVIIVSAGPSLRKNVSQLRVLKDKALIVAVSHSYELLKKNGVQPDFIIQTDPEDVENDAYDYLKHDEDKKTGLIVSTQCARSLQRRYNGNCYYFDMTEECFPHEVLDKKKVKISGGSVSTEAFRLFAEAGFKTIIFTGQDLAYGEDGMSHACNAINISDEKEEFYEVEGIYGGKVRTRADWYLFLRYYEEIIPIFHDVHVIDASEGGARITGTEVLTLEETIDRYCKRIYPVEEWVGRVPKAGEEGLTTDLFIKHLDELFEQAILTQTDLNEIVLCGYRIKKHIEDMQAEGEYFSQICDRYDHLYHKILEQNTSALIRRYSEADIQDYVQDALVVDDDYIKKLELEERLFTAMKNKIADLIAYLQELIEQRKNGAK